MTPLQQVSQQAAAIREQLAARRQKARDLADALEELDFEIGRLQGAIDQAVTESANREGSPPDMARIEVLAYGLGWGGPDAETLAEFLEGVLDSEGDPDEAVPGEGSQDTVPADPEPEGGLSREGSLNDGTRMTTYFRMFGTETLVEVIGPHRARTRDGDSNVLALQVTPETEVRFKVPDGAVLHSSDDRDVTDWTAGVVDATQPIPVGQVSEFSVRYLWLEHPDQKGRKRFEYSSPMILILSVWRSLEHAVPEEGPVRVTEYAANLTGGFFRLEAIAALCATPEGQHQIGRLADYGNDSLHRRRWFERHSATGLVDVSIDSDGHHAFDLLGDVLLLWHARRTGWVPWDPRDAVANIAAGKFARNLLCYEVFGQACDWDKANPFKLANILNTGYYVAPQLLDIVLAYRFVRDAGMVRSVFPTPQHEERLRIAIRCFCSEVIEETMALKNAHRVGMWRSALVMAGRIARLLLPDLDLPPLVGYLERTGDNGHVIQLGADGPEWRNRFLYTQHANYGLVLDIYCRVLIQLREPIGDPIFNAWKLLTQPGPELGLSALPAKQKSAGDKDWCIGNLSALTPDAWLPAGTTLDSLLRQDHALALVFPQSRTVAK